MALSAQRIGVRRNLSHNNRRLGSLHASAPERVLRQKRSTNPFLTGPIGTSTAAPRGLVIPIRPGIFGGSGDPAPSGPPMGDIGGGMGDDLMRGAAHSINQMAKGMLGILALTAIAGLVYLIYATSTGDEADGDTDTGTEPGPIPFDLPDMHRRIKDAIDHAGDYNQCRDTVSAMVAEFRAATKAPSTTGWRTIMKWVAGGTIIGGMPLVLQADTSREVPVRMPLDDPTDPAFRESNTAYAALVAHYTTDGHVSTREAERLAYIADQSADTSAGAANQFMFYQLLTGGNYSTFTDLEGDTAQSTTYCFNWGTQAAPSLCNPEQYDYQPIVLDDAEESKDFDPIMVPPTALTWEDATTNPQRLAEYKNYFSHLAIAQNFLAIRTGPSTGEPFRAYVHGPDEARHFVTKFEDEFQLVEQHLDKPELVQHLIDRIFAVPYLDGYHALAIMTRLAQAIAFSDTISQRLKYTYINRLVAPKVKPLLTHSDPNIQAYMHSMYNTRVSYEDPDHPTVGGFVQAARSTEDLYRMQIKPMGWGTAAGMLVFVAAQYMYNKKVTAPKAEWQQYEDRLIYNVCGSPPETEKPSRTWSTIKVFMQMVGFGLASTTGSLAEAYIQDPINPVRKIYDELPGPPMKFSE